MKLDPWQIRSDTSVDAWLFRVAASLGPKAGNTCEHGTPASRVLCSSRHQRRARVVNASVFARGSGTHLIRADVVLRPLLLTLPLFYLRKRDLVQSVRLYRVGRCSCSTPASNEQVVERALTASRQTNGLLGTDPVCQLDQSDVVAPVGVDKAGMDDDVEDTVSPIVEVGEVEVREPDHDGKVTRLLVVNAVSGRENGVPADQSSGAEVEAV